MSMEPRPIDTHDGAEPAVRRLVPEGVIRGIKDIEDGNTATLDELKDATKF